jgi:threonylcarbamoyladenosine tRNA methylthiotransferase MtaB
VNQADAEALRDAIHSQCEVADALRGEVVVVHTCTVTADAARAGRQAIRRAAREGARVIAAGCDAERCGAALGAIPGVVGVVGARRGAELLRVVREAIGCASRTAVPGPTGTHARPILKVQDGCDCACSYCAVPLARGHSRSMPIAPAIARARALGRASAEVVLAGVHLGAFGRDLAPRASLDDLVAGIALGGAVHRLRLSSVEPHELPHAALEGPAREVACPHFHLPIQSGSDRVLAAMRRPYRVRDVARAVERLAAAFPGAAIGADLLAGFPGETAEDHAATLRLVRALPLAALHVFPFSPRPGTAAARLARPPRGEVRARAAALRAEGDRLRAAFLDRLVGRAVEAVVERVEGGAARGTTREGAEAAWRADPADARGAAVRVLVTHREGDLLHGTRSG